MDWKPTTIAAVRQRVESDLASGDDEQVRAFKKYAVEPYFAAISRYDKMGNVAVIGQRQDEVLYWEDVEEGFNISPVDRSGRILEHQCNQDALGLALNSWIEGRTSPPKLG